MIKRALLLLVLVMLTLSACASPTEVPAVTQQAASVVPAKAECRVAADRQPDPTLEALLPPPTDKDWVLGPGTATLTLMEYSDFQ